jgi:hypothetical protein
MSQMQEIEDRIRELLLVPGTHYFQVEIKDGDSIKIRVSDHSANRQNNGDQLTLSFISQRTPQKKSAYNAMHKEWSILENGLTDTYQELSEIIADNINL